MKAKMRAIICYEASDIDWVKENPHGIIVIEVADIAEKEVVVQKICEIIAEYKENEKNWNYQDAMEAANQWLQRNGYLVKIPLFSRVDLG